MLDCSYPREGGRWQRRFPWPSFVFLPHGEGVVLIGRPAVVQDLAYPFHELDPRLWAQIGFGEMVGQVQKLSSFVIVQRFIIVALLRFRRRRCNLPPGGDKQPLLYPLHGGVVIVGNVWSCTRA